MIIFLCLLLSHCSQFMLLSIFFYPKIKARDVKWRHVGGGSTEKIMKRYTWSDIDEDELLGLGMYPGLIYATARRQPCFVL